MKRPWHVWLLFGVCFGALVAAMAWVSHEMWQARKHAELEERVRLALSRMDAAVFPLIVRENSRPYFFYDAFYAAGRSYNRLYVQIKEGEVLLPSPLLTETNDDVILYFQVDADGRVSSPRVPEGNERDLAEAQKYTTTEHIRTAAGRLDELERLIDTKALFKLEETPHHTIGLPVRPLTDTPGDKPPVFHINDEPQQERSQQELYQRIDNTQKAAKQVMQSQLESTQRLGATEVSYDTMRPLWRGGALVLVRRVTDGDRRCVQGAWLNWDHIHRSLEEQVSDLLPEAKLVPVTSSDTEESGLLLAALPASLVPGNLPAGAGEGVSAMVMSLVLAWACVLVAAGAVAGLLMGAISLSERRGAFVSAVTHELRTPLTTFRMYTEMLENGMITDEPHRQEYLGTLRTEAERLCHLVDNVLAYARLEKGVKRGRTEVVSLVDLTERVRDLLSTRAGQAGMEFAIENGTHDADIHVRADGSVVEQILFNLVDNACKYARDAADKRIRLYTRRTDRTAELRICDAGPGIAPEDLGRLFQPFRKSARRAADSAPGVGLGLALCRRLAREMKGNLTLDKDCDGGACFVLSLPLA